MKVKKDLDSKMIIKEVADYFHIPVDQMKAKGRLIENVTARYIAMYFCKSLLHMSLNEIGRLFNGNNTSGKNHATVLHGIRRINNDLDVSKKMRNDVWSIQNRFALDIDYNVSDYFGVFSWPVNPYKETVIDFSIPFVSPYGNRESCTNRAYSGYIPAMR